MFMFSIKSLGISVIHNIKLLITGFSFLSFKNVVF